MDSTAWTILDRYRCPEAFASMGSILPVSGASGYFRFGEDIICYGSSAAGNLAASPNTFLADLSEGVRRNGHHVVLPFDPAQVIDNLRLERYAGIPDGAASARGQGLSLRQIYYFLRPLLPVALRKQFQKVYLRDWKKIPFPHWPLDVTVEQILERLLFLFLKTARIDSVPFIWFWPDGADSAAMVTHDVETAAGRDFCPALMDLDESYGIRAAFQVIPEKRYPVTAAFLEEIRARGHEINVQDLNHDGHLFRDYAEFRARAKRINQYGREFGANGFRSAVLYRNLDWYDHLEFEYDMTVPNTGHLDPQRGGCCTVFPYFIGDILELPVTATQDYSLFHILGDYTLDLWKAQAAGVQAKHGLLSFIIHPDYVLDPKARKTYQSLLEFLAERRAEGGMWTATPNQINQWWRLRSRMKLVHKHGAWRIEGPGSERAVLAYAGIRDGGIEYTREPRLA